MARRHRVANVSEVGILAGGAPRELVEVCLPDDHGACPFQFVDSDGVPGRHMLGVDRRPVCGSQPGRVEEVFDEHRYAGQRSVQSASGTRDGGIRAVGDHGVEPSQLVETAHVRLDDVCGRQFPGPHRGDNL